MCEEGCYVQYWKRGHEAKGADTSFVSPGHRTRKQVSGTLSRLLGGVRSLIVGVRWLNGLATSSPVGVFRQFRQKVCHHPWGVV